MTRNYQLVYYVAENVGIKGILGTGVSKNYTKFNVKRNLKL